MLPVIPVPVPEDILLVPELEGDMLPEPELDGEVFPLPEVPVDDPEPPAVIPDWAALALEPAPLRNMDGSPILLLKEFIEFGSKVPLLLLPPLVEEEPPLPLPPDVVPCCAELALEPALLRNRLGSPMLLLTELIAFGSKLPPLLPPLDEDEPVLPDIAEVPEPEVEPDAPLLAPVVPEALPTDDAEEPEALVPELVPLDAPVPLLIPNGNVPPERELLPDVLDVPELVPPLIPKGIMPLDGELLPPEVPVPELVPPEALVPLLIPEDIMPLERELLPEVLDAPEPIPLLKENGVESVPLPELPPPPDAADGIGL